MVKAIRASALTLLLACSAQAGVMQNESPTAPPPSKSASAVQEPTAASYELTANGYMQNEAPSDWMQVALDVLAALPSLF